jgi:prolyl-tRNA synthetase
LVGIPFRIVTGRSLQQGKVEVVKRSTHEAQEIALTDVVATLQQWISAV